MDLQALLQRCRERVETALKQRLPEEGPQPLTAAMRYATLDGGKRVRAALVYLTGEGLGADPAALDAPACALELIHAYSLVHDDLPAMDDDDLRRGKPTCHRAFDEATAILAGDGLQSLAYEVLAVEPTTVAPERRLEMVGTLARAAGVNGMVGGQALDIAAVGGQPDLDSLRHMHGCKTGALIRAAVRLGGLAAPAATPRILDDLDRYAKALGLAFQIRDDVLDVEGATDDLGKPRGSDEARGKATYTSLLGLDQAKRLAREAADEAIERLRGMGEAVDPLRRLADYVVERGR